MIKSKVPLGNYITPYSVKNKNNEDIPVYSVTNSEGFCRDYFSKEVASKDKTTYKIVPKGCFAYNPSRINVGSIDWQREEERVIVSPLYNVFSISEELDAQFLYYYLKSDMSLHYIKELASGSVRDNLKLETLMEFPIPELPLSAQKKISSILDNLTEAVSIANLCLGKLDQLVKSRFIEMFGDPVKNQHGYPLVSLSEYIDFLTSGSRGWAKYCVDDGDEWFITIKNVKNCRITTENMQSVHAPKNAEAQRTRVQEGDLLISITADLGRTGVVSKEIANHGAYINQHLSCIRLKKGKLLPLYVAYFMESPAGKMQFLAQNQSAVKAGLNFDSIKSLRLLAPPIKLQENFVSFIDEIDKSKLAVKECLKKAEYLKSALMQEYFG